MRHFLLARELPAIFTLCLVGAAFSFGNAQPAWGVWLLFAALWCFLLWVILLPALSRQRATPDNHQYERQQQQRGNPKQRAKRCRTT